VPVLFHVHSWYSLLEGASSPDALLRRAKACGYSALALTDTNNLYGCVSFAELAKQHEIRPIFGACLRQGQSRCVALIAQPAGYRSLCRIISRIQLSAVDLSTVLSENADGLHVLVDEVALVEALHGAFGPRLWLEIIRPRGTDRRHEEELLAAGRRLGIQPVASAAVHFATPADYPTFRLVTAVRQGTLLEQLPRRLGITPDHHLVDRETLQHRFRDLPEAVINTDRLAEQLKPDVLPNAWVLPPPFVPRQCDAAGFLRALCERGMRRRALSDHHFYRQRLREELKVILDRNLAGYFLVVRDIARYARRRGHPMALRGSAGNSLVCYLLEITDVDPLRFGLPMERFLHADRPDLPDIDLDFDWKVRDDVIDHVFRRYGPQHTAMISSHLFLQPRSAFREAAKVHGLSNEQISALDWGREDKETRRQGDKETEAPVWSPCPLVSLPPGLSLQPPRQFPLEPERWPRIVAAAQALLGRPHHLSIHPGGVVITPGPIEEYIPLQMAAKGVVITQLDKDGVEAIGLVKIDLLGNRALGTLEETLRHASPGDLRPPLAVDPATLALLRAGDTLGVNQLESPAMRHLLLQMQPRGIEDVIQSLALIRPGAASIGAKETFIRRRRGLEPTCFPHPCLEQVLCDTYGLMLYEDDALRVVQALTGLSAPAADKLRKEIAKHRTAEEATALAHKFLAACAHNGVPRGVSEELWVQLGKFNRYSFCKSHAVSYGLIAWQAAALKAHQPLPFWTAALNNNQGMYPRHVYVEAIKRAGIDVLLPCINRSAGPFAVDGKAIRTGLDAVGSLDEALRLAILAERGQHGLFGDLADFRRRVNIGPESLALLIRCGALDFTGKPRPALFLEADLASGGRKSPGDDSRDDLPGEFRELFPSSPVDWQPADYSARRRLLEEWHILGFVVGPPMIALFRGRLPEGVLASRDLRQHVGKRVRVTGLVATGRTAETEDGRTMQFITLQDEWGLTDVTLFPGTCPLVARLTLGPYCATGIVEEQYDVITLTAERFEALRERQASGS
jgi:DNA-directed DNA polymerase III PolC